MDILTILKYALETNPMAYETFGGLQVFTTDVADEIKRIFQKAYQPLRLYKAFSGQITCYKLKPKFESTLKIVTEMAFLALRVKFLDQVSQSEPPPTKMRELIDKVPLTEGQNQMLQALIQRRMSDKNAMFEANPEFNAFIDEAHSTEAPVNQGIDRKAIQKLCDDLFLTQFK